MIPTSTIKVIPKHRQNYSPNLIPVSSNVVNYNTNNLLIPKAIYNNKTLISTPTITIANKKPYTNSHVYAYNQNYQPYYKAIQKVRTPQSVANIQNLGTIKITNNRYRAIPRGISSISQIEYINRFGNLTYNNLNQYSNYPMIGIEPDFNLKLNEYVILNQIGKGSEGVIYRVRWNRNNKNYAMKKSEIQSLNDLNARRQQIITLRNYINFTGSDGILKTFGCLCLPNNAGFFDFYEVMELAEGDWENEISRRQQGHLFYNEYELMEIIKRLVRNFSSLQANHITHRDIKPQNIMFVNGVLKICDFGDAKLLKKKGIIVQRIRGSELFMSPIVFKAYHAGMKQIQHNTFKSDVFSLGMCFFFAACLSYDGPSYIREIYDMNMIRNVLYQFLGRRYSQNFINILWTMLQVEENQRPDFNQLQMMFQLY